MVIILQLRGLSQSAVKNNYVSVIGHHNHQFTDNQTEGRQCQTLQFALVYWDFGTFLGRRYMFYNQYDWKTIIHIPEST